MLEQAYFKRWALMVEKQGMRDGVKHCIVPKGGTKSTLEWMVSLDFVYDHLWNDYESILTVLSQGSDGSPMLRSHSLTYETSTSTTRDQLHHGTNIPTCY